MRRQLLAVHPESLACALIEDGGRVLFLVSRSRDGREELSLPSILLKKGEDPVSSLAAAVRAQTGIDAHVQSPVLQGMFNSGSKRNRKLIAAIAFSVTSKSYSAKPGAGFTSAVWLKAEDAKAKRFSRASEWLRNCARV